MNIRFAEEKDFNSCVELDLHKNVNIIKNKIHMKLIFINKKQAISLLLYLFTFINNSFVDIVDNILLKFQCL